MKIELSIATPLLPSGAVVDKIDWVVRDIGNNVIWNKLNDTSNTYVAIMDVLEFTSGTLEVTLYINRGGTVTPYKLAKVPFTNGVNVTPSDIWSYPVKLTVTPSLVTDKPSIDITVPVPEFWYGTSDVIGTNYVITDLSGNVIYSRINDTENTTSITIPKPIDVCILEVTHTFSDVVNQPVSRVVMANRNIHSITATPTLLTGTYDNVDTDTTDITIAYGNSVLTDVSYTLSDIRNGVLSSGEADGDVIHLSHSGLGDTVKASLVVTGRTPDHGTISNVITLDINLN